MCTAHCKGRFPLPELTARVDGWPVSITRQPGRVDGQWKPSTRVVETGLKQWRINMMWRVCNALAPAARAQNLSDVVFLLAKLTVYENKFGNSFIEWLNYNKKDGYRQQNVRQRQKLISIIDYDVCILENLQPFWRYSASKNGLTLKT